MLELFIPHQIGSVRLMPERRLALHVTKTWVYATLVVINRAGIQVEKILHEPIAAEIPDEYAGAAAQAIHTIIQQAGSYDTLISCLNGIYCIFKSVRLPFISEDKAKLVIGHELEPSLPYKLSSAVCDALITYSNTQDGSCQVIGVATQKTFLEQHLALFKSLDMVPDIVTTDVCALYNLSRYLPYVMQVSTPTILIYIASHTTTLVMVQNGQYRASRSLNKGVLNIARTLSKTLAQSPAQVMHLLERGEQNGAVTKQARDALQSFWKDLEFTIRSFLKHVHSEEKGVSLTLAGQNISLPDICAIASESAGWSCKPLTIHDLINVTIPAGRTIPSSQAICLGAALPLLNYQAFNLLRSEYRASQAGPITKTLLITSGIVATTIIGAFMLNWSRVRSLTHHVESGAHEGISMLRESFTAKEVSGLDKTIRNPIAEFASLVKKAKETVNKQDNMWQEFAQTAQSSFLYHLYLLSNEFDKKALGLRVERLSMNGDGTIRMEASVRDYDALNLLNRQFRESAHFALVSAPPQELSFDIAMRVQDSQG